MTVELAIGLVTAVLLTAILAGVVLIGVAQAACARTSNEMARHLARGDGAAATKAEAEAPPGAQSRVQRQRDGVSVTTTVPVGIVGLGAMVVTAESWAAWEPGVGDATQE